jgi:methylated-DNA-[protein]-cysteine S-methyltransferase
MGKRLLFDRIETPIGDTVLVCDEQGNLCLLRWDDAAHSWRAALSHHHPDAELVEASDPFGHTRALAAYMEGEIAAIAGLRVAFAGTPFQHSVWSALRTIPAGQTRSYGSLARAIGRPRAMRAVGLANGKNPIAIVVPCHRVIGSDGSLTGFGGGLERKRWLLEHEVRHTSVDLFQYAGLDAAGTVK